MSGPLGLAALLVSMSCGVIAGRWPPEPWYLWVLFFAAIALANALAGLLDYRMGWRTWRRERP